MALRDPKAEQAIAKPQEIEAVDEVEEIEAVDAVDAVECVDDDEEMEEEDLDSLDDAMFDPMQQLTQLLVTESGVPIVDVLHGIQEALEKQNKILYKLVSVIETK